MSIYGKPVIIAGGGTNTDDATATAEDIRRGKTAYARGEKLTGTYDGIIPAGNKDIETTSQYGVAAYATARISEAERRKIIPANIKDGITMLGVTGTYSGIDTSDATATAADIIASKTAYVNGIKLTGTLVVPTYQTWTGGSY